MEASIIRNREIYKDLMYQESLLVDAQMNADQFSKLYLYNNYYEPLLYGLAYSINQYIS